MKSESWNLKLGVGNLELETLEPDAVESEVMNPEVWKSESEAWRSKFGIRNFGA